MKNMKTVYNKVKRNYKKIEIELMDKEDYLIIKKNNIKIEASLDKVDFFKDNKLVSHIPPKDYDGIYNYISLFLEDNESMNRRIEREGKVRTFIFVIIVILVVMLESFLELGDTILLYLGAGGFAIALISLIRMAIKEVYKKHLLKKVNKVDLDLIMNFESMPKNWNLAKDYQVVLDFENIDFLCTDFLDMKKNLRLSKTDYIDDELKIVVLKSKNKELIKWYAQIEEVVECIYKYYDENGIRKF